MRPLLDSTIPRRKLDRWLILGHLLVLPLLSGFIWTGRITPFLL